MTGWRWCRCYTTRRWLGCMWRCRDPRWLRTTSCPEVRGRQPSSADSSFRTSQLVRHNMIDRARCPRIRTWCSIARAGARFRLRNRRDVEHAVCNSRQGTTPMTAIIYVGVIGGLVGVYLARFNTSTDVLTRANLNSVSTSVGRSAATLEARMSYRSPTRRCVIRPCRCHVDRASLRRRR
jgi:hypothetical protein